MTVTTQGTTTSDRYTEKVLQYHRQAAQDEQLPAEQRAWYAALVEQENA